ncbi:hypothetical protein [Nonomuraea insulae]|uniref:PLAT domain-containing protein n=1 Tax=Nonomuraea insulae TaxID=1616787 RepID=A0ABW1CX55_9ACTN
MRKALLLILSASLLVLGLGSPAPASVTQSVDDTLIAGTIGSAALRDDTAAGSAKIYVFDAEQRSGKLASLAHTTTDSSGRFSLPLAGNTSGITKSAAKQGGWNNFMLLVVDGDMYDVQHFTRRYDGQRWIDRSSKPSAQVNVPVSPQMRAATDKGSSVAQPFTASANDGSLTLEATEVDCETTCENVATTAARVEIEGNMKATFTYGQTVSSEIETGVGAESGEGGLISWKISGSVHIGTNAGFTRDYILAATTKYVGAAAYIKLGMNYVDTKYCNFAVCYRVRQATAWTGEISQVTDIPMDDRGPDSPIYASKYWDCTPHENMGKVEKTSGNNMKYVSAAEIGGLKLGATTAWTDSFKVTWEFETVEKFVGNIEFCMVGSNTWASNADEIYWALAQ